MIARIGILTLGGCAGAPWPSDGKLPERVVDKLKECGEQGPIPLASVSYDLTFTVHVTEDENEARVDDVMLMHSTLHFHEVEACMRDALYSMRTPLEALALRRRNLSPGKAAEPEARSLFSQAQVVLFMEVAAVIVVGYAAYTVVVHLLVDKHGTKPRSHHAKPETAEPPAPAPALAGARRRDRRTDGDRRADYDRRSQGSPISQPDVRKRGARSSGKGDASTLRRCLRCDLRG